MKKSVPRGSYEERVSMLDGIDMSCVVWKDNKVVTLLSTYALPVTKVNRYDKAKREKIDITCPFIVQEYNKHMGGVDLMDSYLGRNHITLRSKKYAGTTLPTYFFFIYLILQLQMLGDNLSSHISVDVLRACEENNVRFVCLPPNSTHLTQPLDVAFFRPMKVAWRNSLTEWKASKQGSREAVVQKSSFPFLLAKLIAELEKNHEQNLKSGFRKCGIYPIDITPLLAKLPQPLDKDALQDSFLETLEAKRLEWTKGVGTRKRRSKLNIVPGKSVTDELNTLANEKENEDFVQPSTSKRSHSRGGDSESTYAESEKVFRSLNSIRFGVSDLKKFIGATSYNVYFCKRQEQNKVF
ncbi:unnamed protein product [Colias eurytheme]|nr:unnamed protein product [Colias eurytheme]